MPVIRVGVQSPAGGNGQVVDLDGLSATIARITNASGESVQYSTDGGVGWSTIAAAASTGSLGTVAAGLLRVRKLSAGAYPAPVDVDATINGVSEVSLTSAQVEGLGAAPLSQAGSTVAVLNAGKTALRDPAGGADIALDLNNFVNFARYSPDTTGAADCTALLNAALADLYAAGGGTLVFPAGKIKIAGQIILPNDNGATSFPTGASLQPSYKWVGQGAYASGQTQSMVEDGIRSPGGTVLLCTYASAIYNNAKFVTRGLGLWECTGITFQDPTVGAVTPFVYTTNTTLHFHDNAFVGGSGGSSCAQDGIVLGGKNKHDATGYGDFDGPFQGYGTVISSNYFQRIRRTVYGRSYCNQVQIYSNYMDKGCGTNTPTAGCIEIDGTLDTLGNTGGGQGDTCTNNAIYGNYMHWVGGYTYLVILRKCSRHWVGYNGFIDTGAAHTAGVRMEGQNIGPGYPCSNNMIIGNSNSIDVHYSEDALSSGKNWVIGGGTAEGLTLPANLNFSVGSVVKIPVPSNANSWKIWDGVTNWLHINGAAGRLDAAGELRLNGNSSNAGATAGTTAVTVGNNSTPSDAVINMNAPAGQANQIQFKRAGVNSWLIYDGNSSLFFVRDSVSGVMALTFTPGAGTTGLVEFGGTVRIKGAKVEMGTGGPTWTTGSGSPETVLSAPVGSLYTSTGGGVLTTLYVKTSGAGNTGWTAK